VEFLKDLVPLGQLTGIGVLTIIGWLVITRKLVWHDDLAEVKRERDEWKKLALSMLGVTEKLTVQAEVTNAVISKAEASSVEEK
jgi:hypothetical protein